MSQSKVTEIKNKMMRMQEQMLKDKDIQNKQVMSFNMQWKYRKNICN